jgi:uncharacterized protein YgiM (DUF1202 family)
MKKVVTLFLCLALMSLACLETSSAARLPPRTTNPTITLTNKPIDSQPAQVCAVVTADTAQNLRLEADVASQVLTWLKNGEVVQVLDQVNVNWWHVKRGDDVGFARSIYLEKVECVK